MTEFKPIPIVDQPPAREPAQGLVSRRHLLIGGALACASAIAYVRQPQPASSPISKERFEGWVPQHFQEWRSTSQSGVLLPPPDSLRDRLYDNLVTRVFRAPELPGVMLLLAYNNVQNGVLQVHRPEVCYPVGGYALSETRPITLPVMNRPIPANFFTATGPDRTEQVMYFTRMGKVFPRTWAEQRLGVIQSNLAGTIPDGFMLRASLLGESAQSALATLRKFTEAFARACPPPLRQLLLG